MRNLFVILFGLLTYSCLVLADSEQIKVVDDKAVYTSARLETCGGWRLNRLPKVRAFIYDHADLYKKFQVKYIGGADPELVFVKQDDSEERYPVDELSTEDICSLLDDRGFEKISNPEPPPPEDEEDFNDMEEEDFPGIDETDDDMKEIRAKQVPAAPGSEDEAHRPGPLSPEEELELEELMKKEEL